MTNRPQRSLLNKGPAGLLFIFVMGVCGTGKTTLGVALAEALDVPFIDGDDLHPPENVAKMARGVPLDDEDRGPWLEAVKGAAVASVARQRARAGVEAYEARPGVVVACSALKRAYRETLRTGDDQTYFVYLEGEREVLMARMRARQGHFMKVGMLESQLETLESPVGEPGVVTVSVEMTTEVQVQQVVEALRIQ